MTINGPEQLTTLKQHMKDRAPVLFAAAGLNIGFQSTIIKASESNLTISNTIPPEFITKVIESNLYTVQLNMSLLSSSKIDTDGVNLVLPLDTLEVINDHRRSERQLIAEDNEAIVELINPIDHRTILRKYLIDISKHGLSFRNLNNSLLFQAGQSVPKITVKMKDQNLFYKGAKIVYNRRFFTTKGRSFYQVGLEFTN